jgi:uncharacterized membrane protein
MLLDSVRPTSSFVASSNQAVETQVLLYFSRFLELLCFFGFLNNFISRVKLTGREAVGTAEKTRRSPSPTLLAKGAMP